MKILAILSFLSLTLSGPLALAQDAGGAASEETVSAAAPATWIIPDNISTYGGEIDFLFELILVITTIVGLLVIGIMIYCIVKFREQEGRRAHFSHGSTRLEVAWTLVTAAILIILAVVQKDAWTTIKQELPPESESFIVRVFAERFAWSYVYPGQDGVFEPNDDKNIFPGFNDLGLADPTKDVVLQQLIVPGDTPVILELISKGKFDPNTQQGEYGVLHSFFSPHLRLKQDIVPGLPQKIWFQVLPGKEGTYEIACAELCGEGHYLMNSQMKVTSHAEVNAAIGYDWKAFPARFSSEETKEGDD